MKRGNKSLLSVICFIIAGIVLLVAAGACAEEDLTPVLTFYVNGLGNGSAEGTYAIIPSSFEPGEGMEYTCGGFDAKPNNDYLLWETYGTYPAWTVEQVSGDTVAFETETFTANEGSWHELFVRLNETPQTAQDLVFNVTCDWEGHISTQAFTMHFIDTALPEGVTVPDVIDMQVGTEQELTVDFSPSLSWDNDGTRFNLNIMNNEEGFFSSDSYNGISSWENTFTPQRAGNAAVSLRVYYANLAISKMLILRIADENGNFDNNIPASVAVSAANFPDENLRNAVRDAFDRDRDQVLSSAELLAATSLHINNVGSLSLAGIEHLPFLESLSCGGNRLADADFSGNPKLRELYCNSCSLTSLDVSRNPELERLDCTWNQLRSLDVSHNPKLSYLNCTGNDSLKSLDLSQNPLLDELSCTSCGLMSLDVSHNPHLSSLYCFNNMLSVLDLSQNAELSVLSCYGNCLTSLDLSHNPGLYSLECYQNGISALDVTANELLSTAVQENTRCSYYSFDKIGYSMKIDRGVTVTAGNFVSAPLVNGNGTQGENAPIIEIPESIALGENLTGTITASEEAYETYYYLYYMNGSVPEYQDSFWLSDSGVQKTLFEYSYNRLYQPGTYRLMAVSDFGESVQEITIRSFTVTGTQPQAPQVTAEVTQGYKNDTFTFRLTLAKGGEIQAKQIRGTETEYYFRRASGTEYSWDIPLNEAGEYSFSFAAQTDGIWSEYSVPVVIHVTSRGQLDAPENAVVPATLRAGEPLILVTEEHSGADEYAVTIRGKNVNNTWYQYDSGVPLVEYGLDAGEYTLEIVARGNGYDDSEPAVRRLIVTGERPKGAQITIPDGRHYYYTNYWLTISGDNVDAAVWANGSGDVFLSDGSSVRLPVAVYPYQEDVAVRVKIDGCWSDTIPVNMEAEYGSVDEDNELEVLSAPESIQLGDGLPFRIQLWEEARDYTYSVSFLTGDEEEGYDREQVVYELVFTPDENGNAVIPAQYFRQAGLCEIGLNAYNDNYEGKYASFRVTVTENTNRPAAPTVTLLTTDPVPYTDAQVQISAPGASRVCLLIQDAYEPSAVICNPLELDLDAEGNCIYLFNNKNISYSWSDRYLVSASAYNGAWSGYCLPAQINLTFDGELPYMGDAVTFEPEEPMLGDTVTMHWAAVPGAEFYGIMMDDREKVFVPAEQTSYTYPAGEFEAGEHWATVFAYAVGKQPGSQDGRMTVLDPADRPTLTADKTAIQVNQTVKLNIRSTTGGYVMIYQNGNLQARVQRDASGDQNAVIRFAAPGTYTIQARTGREAYSGYSPMSEPVVITVMGKERLAAPTLLNIEHGDTVGQGASASFTFPEGTRMKYIEFGSLDENGEFFPLRWDNLEVSLSVEGYDIQEPGTYQFRARAMAQYSWEEPSEEYEDSEWTTCNFTVGDADLQTLSFTLSAEEINYGETLDITVTPPAEKYAVHRSVYDLITDEDLDSQGGFSEEDAVTSTCHMGPGRYVFRVSGLYNGLWSKIGEFSYRVLPVGWVEIPTVVYQNVNVDDSLTTALTDNLVFSVSAENAVRISWELNRVISETKVDWCDDDSEDGDAVTIDLTGKISETGTYQLIFRGLGADGWASRGDHVVLLTVQETGTETWEPVFPDTITPGQDIRVVIPEAEGAVSYNVNVYDGQFATFYDKVTSPGEYMIPAAAFSEGGWFNVAIGASDGITDDYKWSQKEYSDVAPASGLTALKAAIVTSDVQEGEPISFALSAENPSRIIVQQWMSWEDAGFPGNPGGDWFVTDYLKNGGSSFSKFRQPSDGHYSFRFAALVNGKWTAWSNEALPGAGVINLPANLTTVESEAFANVSGPAVVHVPGSVTSIADDAFDADAVISAPAGSYAIEWARTHNRLYIEE